MSKVVEATVEANASDHASNEEKPRKKTSWTLLWDTLDKTPEERAFLFRLDAGLLTIACLGTLYTVVK